MTQLEETLSRPVADELSSMNDKPMATGPGETLRAERERRGLSLEQAGDPLRLLPAQLRALEQNRFDFFPAEIFIRGHLRSYGNFLQLDVDALLLAYEQNHRLVTTRNGGMQQPLTPSMLPGQQKSKKHFLGIVAVLLVALLLWWLNDSGSATSESADGTDSSAISNESALQLDDAQLEAVTPLSSESSGNSEAIEAQLIEAAAAAAALAADRPPAADGPVVETQLSTPMSSLSLQFSDDCWLEVRDASGKALVSALQMAGSSLELEAEAPVVVLLGYAPAATISFNGEPVSIEVRDKSNSARVVLK